MWMRQPLKTFGGPWTFTATQMMSTKFQPRAQSIPTSGKGRHRHSASTLRATQLTCFLVSWPIAAGGCRFYRPACFFPSRPVERHCAKRRERREEKGQGAMKLVSPPAHHRPRCVTGQRRTESREHFLGRKRVRPNEICCRRDTTRA